MNYSRYTVCCTYLGTFRKRGFEVDIVNMTRFLAFGTSTASGGLFGTTNTNTSNPFGAATNSLFGNAGFAAAAQPGTTVKFNVSLTVFRVLQKRTQCSNYIFY